MKITINVSAQILYQSVWQIVLLAPIFYPSLSPDLYHVIFYLFPKEVKSIFSPLDFGFGHVIGFGHQNEAEMSH